MDLLITEKNLRRFLKTKASLETITTSLSESGPTVDRVHQVGDENLLEIEVITNRIDCASVFGIAREANTILKQKKIATQLTNDPYQTPEIVNHQTQKINLSIEERDLVHRFLAVTIDDISIKGSTDDIQKNLELVNQRAINNLVDITNLTTILYGIPSHVFDKDKLDLTKLTIRSAKVGESLTLLDDSTIKLQDKDLIIEDGSGNLIDLCCVMGGRHAIVDEHTKNILLIIPVCDAKRVRQTSLFHQKRTIASQIFEKKPDVSLTKHVFNIIAKQIMQTCGGHLSSSLLDINNTKQKDKHIKLDLNWLSNFIGQEIPQSQVVEILEGLGMTTSLSKDGKLLVSIPSFRLDDLNNQEDLAEEIARIYGYQNIAPQFPELKTASQNTESIFKCEEEIRDILSTLGYYEVINSSLISQTQIENSKQNPKLNLKLKNALSEDLEYMRSNLAINAIQNHSNNRGQLTDNSFFEMGNVYSQHIDRIVEKPMLCLSTTKSILDLKSTLNKLFGLLKFSSQLSLKTNAENLPFLNLNNTIGIFSGDTQIGYLAEVSSFTSSKFLLSKTISLAEIDLKTLVSITPLVSYTPTPDFPDIIDDINIKSAMPLGQIHRILQNSKLVSKIIYLDSFQNKHTFRLHFNAKTKNLTQEEVNQIKNQLLESFK